MSETKQNHRNKQNPLPLLKANRKQANLSDIQANRSVPCTQVIISTLVSLNAAQVSLFTVSSQQEKWFSLHVLAILFRFARFGRFGCFGGFVSVVSVVSLVSFPWFRFVVSLHGVLKQVPLSTR